MTRTCHRLPHCLALVAWLLLALQSPWHAGMQAGAHAGPDYTALARSAGISCGAQADAGVIAALVAAGALPATALDNNAGTTAAHALTLCDLFAGLAAVTAATTPAPPEDAATTRHTPHHPASTRTAATVRLPPARAPPALS